ncbi:ParB/RepB/Spo0J family partition protein [Cupriavidus taiwanensis]|uniref:ParB-like N-terminal domain-containing protein n=1 Tax=Cupriavidus taiwanensis TaxID=164546 RepID=A0A375JD00_9BURK|nr:ParB/RepB/Spo0J family partition protein [Cupriavidus taiwanensis]SPS02987.1 hypothetical protein CBM2634_U560004 [Cupriavidus taiwanensis]
MTTKDMLSAAATSDEYYDTLDINLVIPDPDQPRKTIEDGSLAEIAESIKANGITQPIVVRPKDENGQYRIVTGERRWRACLLLEKERIPAIVRPLTQAQAVAEQVIDSISNVTARLSPVERAQALQRYVQGFESQAVAAGSLGKSKAWLSEMLAISELPGPVEDLCESGIVKDQTTLLALKKLSERCPDEARALIEEAKSNGKVEREAVKSLLSTVPKRQRKPKDDSTPPAAPPAAPPTGPSAVPSAAPADVPFEPTPESQHDVGHDSHPKDAPNDDERRPLVAAPDLEHEGRKAQPRRTRKEKAVKAAALLGLPDGVSEDELLDRLLDAYLETHPQEVAT